LAKGTLGREITKELACIAYRCFPVLCGLGVGELFQHFGKAFRGVVSNAKIARREKDDIDRVTLFNEPINGSSHGAEFIRWLGSEDKRALVKWEGTFWPVAIILIWLAAGPPRDGMLQLVEDTDVELVSRTAVSKQIAHAMLIVVLIEQLKHRLVQFSGEPGHSSSNKLVGPVDRSHKPRMLVACETAGCSCV